MDFAAPEPSIESGSHWFVVDSELGPQTLSLIPTHLVVHSGGKAEVARASSGGRVGRRAPVLSLLDLLLLLLLLKLGLSEKFNLILLCLVNGTMDQQIGKYIGRRKETDLETKDFHLHHLHLEALGLLNVYARGEW